MWSDVRGFLESPGEVLERLREQMGSDAAAKELAARREDLVRRLAAKQAEKDRYVRAYAQGHISDDDLQVEASIIAADPVRGSAVLEAATTDSRCENIERPLNRLDQRLAGTGPSSLHVPLDPDEKARSLRR